MSGGSEAPQFVPEEAKQEKVGEIVEFPQAAKENPKMTRAEAVDFFTKIGWAEKNPEALQKKVDELKKTIDVLQKLGMNEDVVNKKIAVLDSALEAFSVAEARGASEAEYARVEETGEKGIVSDINIPELLKKVDTVELLAKIGWDANNPERFAKKVSQLEDVLATLGTLDDEAKQALAQLVSEAEYKNREQSILEARKASEAEYNRRRAAGEFEAEAV